MAEKAKFKSGKPTTALQESVLDMMLKVESFNQSGNGIKASVICFLSERGPETTDNVVGANGDSDEVIKSIARAMDEQEEIAKILKVAIVTHLSKNPEDLLDFLTGVRRLITEIMNTKKDGDKA